MSQLILSRGNTYKKSIIKRFFPNLEPGPYFLILSLITFVILITVTTLIFSTRQVTKGYVLSKLENHHQDLVKKSEQSEMLISKARSLNFIQQSSKVQAMVEPPEIVFLNGDSAIASR
ncbi:MAG: hypothetical protein O3B47_00770 [bacterium]|nr:hypothetical protein [bacterium]